MGGYVDAGSAATDKVFFDNKGLVGGEDGVIVKYASDGTRLWSAIQGTPANDRAQSLDLDDAGNVYIAGRTAGALNEQVTVGNSDLFMVKYDYIGNRKWTRIVGSVGIDDHASISAGGDSLVLVGTVRASALDIVNQGGSDVLIVQYVPECQGLTVGVLGADTFVCPEGHFCYEGINNIASGR